MNKVHHLAFSISNIRDGLLEGLVWGGKQWVILTRHTVENTIEEISHISSFNILLIITQAWGITKFTNVNNYAKTRLVYIDIHALSVWLFNKTNEFS